jgi:hypothetical protein
MWKESIHAAMLIRRDDNMATLTHEQLQAKIASIPEVAPDEIDLAMLAEIDAEKSDEYTSWETVKAERAYNGNISLRIPKDLHRALVGMAKEQGVSLNQYCLYKLASG